MGDKDLHISCVSVERLLFTPRAVQLLPMVEGSLKNPQTVMSQR